MCTCWEWIDQCTSSSFLLFCFFFFLTLFFRRLVCCFFTLWSKGHRATKTRGNTRGREREQFHWHKRTKLSTTWQTSSLSVLFSHTHSIAMSLSCGGGDCGNGDVGYEINVAVIEWHGESCSLTHTHTRRREKCPMSRVSSDTSPTSHVAEAKEWQCLTDYSMYWLQKWLFFTLVVMVVFLTQDTQQPGEVIREKGELLLSLTESRVSETHEASESETEQLNCLHEIDHSARPDTHTHIHTFMERLTCNCNFFSLFSSLLSYRNRMVLVHLQSLLLNIICLMWS